RVIFAYHGIRDVPGLYELDRRKQELSEINERLHQAPSVSVTADFCGALAKAGLKKEEFGDLGLEYIRKKDSTGYVYFVANQQTGFAAGWVTLPEDFGSADCYDPMSGQSGVLKKEGRKIYLQLRSGQSVFIRLRRAQQNGAWPYFAEEQSVVLGGPWTVRFLQGHPVLPHSYRTSELKSWTSSPDTMARYFSGTAEYETTFRLDRSESPKEGFQLDLGDVREVAEVWLNGHDLGIYWSYPYVVNIPQGLLKRAGNILRIKVTNLDANRVIWMDRRMVPWKNFFFVDI